MGCRRRASGVFEPRFAYGTEAWGPAGIPPISACARLGAPAGAPIAHARRTAFRCAEHRSSERSPSPSPAGAGTRRLQPAKGCLATTPRLDPAIPTSEISMCIQRGLGFDTLAFEPATLGPESFNPPNLAHAGHQVAQERHPRRNTPGHDEEEQQRRGPDQPAPTLSCRRQTTGERERRRTVAWLGIRPSIGSLVVAIASHFPQESDAGVIDAHEQDTKLSPLVGAVIVDLNQSH